MSPSHPRSGSSVLHQYELAAVLRTYCMILCLWIFAYAGLPVGNAFPCMENAHVMFLQFKNLL